jgi:hypothetical protein
MTRRSPVPLPPRAILRAGLVLALMTAGFFAFRLAMMALHWSELREPEIEGWMTLGVIARSWDVDRDGLAEALGLELAPGRRLTLADIAERSGRPLAEIEATLAAEIAAQRGGPEPAR